MYPVCLIFLLVGLVSCSEEGEGPDCSLQGTVLSISDIIGNWTATSAIFSATSGSTNLDVDVVAEGGTVSLSIQSGGGFTLNISESGTASDISSGDFCFDEDLLVVLFDGDALDDWEYFGIQLNSGTNVLTINGPAEFDFNDDGNPDQASVSLTLVRS